MTMMNILYLLMWVPTFSQKSVLFFFLISRPFLWWNQTNINKLCPNCSSFIPVYQHIMYLQRKFWISYNCTFVRAFSHEKYFHFRKIILLLQSQLYYTECNNQSNRPVYTDMFSQVFTSWNLHILSILTSINSAWVVVI